VWLVVRTPVRMVRVGADAQASVPVRALRTGKRAGARTTSGAGAPAAARCQTRLGVLGEMGGRSDDEGLWARNSPALFWRLLDCGADGEEWEAACRAAQHCLAGLPAAAQAIGVAGTLAATLGEGQLGERHWQMSRPARAYYALRPLLPAAARGLLQRAVGRPRREAGPLHWPAEERYVAWQREAVRRLLAALGRSSAPYIHFWPTGARFALVLTHDVDSARGQAFVRELASLEERLGFRSSFNLVPEGYAVDRRLLAELRERGFEVGVHGLRHDGKLFSSEQTFRARAQRINAYLAAWQAVGFRAPMTHRHPAWMQALEVEYDSSFFDTDPFEPMPGGTMSIWPFFVGRFVELPYTLAQDHTLLRTLGETSPRLWLEKVEFVARHCGMALLNTHPDYLRNPRYLAVYEEFLGRMHERGGYWHALPAEVARWWRRRADATSACGSDGRQALDLTEATIGQLTLDADGELILAAEGRRGCSRPAAGGDTRR